MNKKIFIDRITSGKPLVADGAMGTYLHEKGIGFSHCFDELNLENPSLVADIHRDYINAGAEIILTNTFGANRYKLDSHGLARQLDEINAAGVELARRAVQVSFKDVMIAGDVGPLGVQLAPFGRVHPDDARCVFKEQIQALIQSNADLIIIETITDLYEIREAIAAARECCDDIPIIASMTFTRDDRTVLGDSPQQVAKDLKVFGADVVGINCSGGPNQLLRILRRMRSALPDGLFWIKPNAGWPEHMGGRIFYPASADYFGDYALSFWKAGARIIGGCCGTTPKHIAAIRDAIDRTKIDLLNGIDQPQTVDKIPDSISQTPTELQQKLKKEKFVIAVEMDPPRGLSTKKLLAGASLLVESGADVIDVADSPMARMRMSPWAVCSLVQQKVGIETVLHFPTRGRNLLRVQGDLLAAHALDVRNVFVVMGDPTAIGDYPDAMDNYDLAPSGLVKLVKQNFNIGVDHAGVEIGEPTSFFVGGALNLTPKDPDRELKVIRRKLKGGADFVLTQPVYSTEPVLRFKKLYQEKFGEFPIPILVGILPLASARHAAFLQQEVPGITIPEQTIRKMEEAGENGAKQGIRIAIDLIKQLQTIAQGIYLMPAFNRFDYAAEIIESIRSKL